MPQNQPAPQHAQDNDEIDLGRLFGVLVDHKWLIAFITALFAIAGIIYALLATPIYRADALVQVEDGAPSMNPLSEVNTMLGKEPPSQSEIGIIRSRMVLGRAVDILNLDVPQAIILLFHHLLLLGHLGLLLQLENTSTALLFSSHLQHQAQ